MFYCFSYKIKCYSWAAAELNLDYVVVDDKDYDDYDDEIFLWNGRLQKAVKSDLYVVPLLYMFSNFKSLLGHE